MSWSSWSGRAALAASLLGVVSCGGEGPAAADSPGGRVMLDAPAVVLAPGQVAGVAARVDGRAAERVGLVLESERRWLAEAEVLDVVALADGRVQGRAPGSAVVRVEVPGAAPARLEVTVRPARPLVVGLGSAAPLQGGDTLVLRGWRLDAAVAGGVVVGGAAALVAGADSVSMRVVLPTATGGDCAAPRALPLTLPDADVAPGLTVPMGDGDALALAVGERRRLTARERSCLRLAPLPGARYALAVMDPRRVRAAESRYEVTGTEPVFYYVRVEEAGSLAPAAARVPAPRSAAVRPLRSTAAAAGDEAADPGARRAPWREGETFPLREISDAAAVSARVARVRGRLVLAFVEGEVPAGGSDLWLARADSALAMAEAHGLGLLRAVLSGTDPVTSAGSGQLLVLARRDPGAWRASTLTRAEGAAKRSYLVLNTAVSPTAHSLLKTLVHELAHAWQEQYLVDSRPAGTVVSGGGPVWAVEGSADLLAGVALARALEIPADGNWDWVGGLGDPRTVPYAVLAASQRGDLAAGYASGAGFLRDLAERLTDAGLGYDAALAQVVRGALEGWHGWDPHGARRTGLAARVRTVLAGEWEPVDGMLVWALSQALDDLGSVPGLRNAAFRGAGSAGLQSGMGWLPQAVLRSGGIASRVDPAAASEVQGNAAALTIRSGGPAYVLLEDDARGGSYRLSATSDARPLDVEWMLVRWK